MSEILFKSYCPEPIVIIRQLLDGIMLLVLLIVKNL